MNGKERMRRVGILREYCEQKKKKNCCWDNLTLAEKQEVNKLCFSQDTSGGIILTLILVIIFLIILIIVAYYGLNFILDSIIGGW